MVVVVWWSTLGGAARDVVDVVRSRRGQSSAWLAQRLAPRLGMACLMARCGLPMARTACSMAWNLISAMMSPSEILWS